MTTQHERRLAPRYPAPKSVPLTCHVEHEGVRFDALVVDVGQGGIGAIVHDPAVRLEVGTVLARASIELPGHAPVLAAIEVRHVGKVTRAGGVVARRAGCRFVAPGTAIETLVRAFLRAAGHAPA